MPKIDMEKYEAAEAKSGGAAYEQMLPGAYLLTITAIRTEWDTLSGHTDGMEKQCVKIIWDVAEGEHAGKFSDDFWADEEHDYGHCVYLSWKNEGYLKHRMNVLEKCNPGFNPLEAFSNDDWAAFIGKKFGAVIDGTVKTNDRGYDSWRLEVGEWITDEQVESGDHRDPRTNDERTVVGGGTSSTDTYSDVPF